MRGIAVWPVLLSAALAGCLISTSGLSGGVLPSDEAGAPEASAPEAGTPDATATTTDSGGDSGQTGPFCANQTGTDVAFCEDFDETTDVSADWNGHARATQGAQALDGSTFVSPAHSLATTLPAGMSDQDSSKTIGATLQRSVGKQSDHVTVDVDLRVESVAGNLADSAQVVTLFFGTNGVLAYSIHIKVDAQQYTLQEDIQPAVGAASYPQEVIPASVILDTWTHVKLDAQFSTHQLSITIGNAAPFVRSMADGAANGQATLEIGAIYFGGAQVPASSFHHDNVLLRMQ